MMKAKPVKFIETVEVECSPEDATHVKLYFPHDVFDDKRYIPVQTGGTRNGTNNWSWNGDTEKPTLKPSILTEMTYAGEYFRCHSFVNNGVVKFLNDCSHDLAGRDCELLNI